MDIDLLSSAPPQKFNNIYDINNDLLKIWDLKTEWISFFS